MSSVSGFLANLLCILVPIFGTELWQIKKGYIGTTNLRATRIVLALSVFVSAILCTLFNFNVSNGVSVNLSVVALTMGFYLLSWRLGNGILLVCLVTHTILSAISLSGNLPTYVVLHAILKSLPNSFGIMIVYSIIMTLCTIWSREKAPLTQTLVFMIGLFIFASFDYMYYDHIQNPTTKFSYDDFLVFIIALELVILVAIRLSVAISEVVKMQQQEIMLARLQVLANLAASVAHEIRNPITVVQGFTDVMLQNSSSGDQQNKYLEIMRDELIRAESVISHYLDLAKPPNDVEHTEFDFSNVCKHVLEAMKPFAIEHKVELEYSIPSDIILHGHRSSITQAVMNVVKNAIESCEHTNGHVDALLRTTGDYVELIVRDNGNGIPSDEIGKLGQPYYSTKAKGTGLGLTMVYKVVHESNGTIQVESQMGKGTTFFIRFPLVKLSVSKFPVFDRFIKQS